MTGIILLKQLLRGVAVLLLILYFMFMELLEVQLPPHLQLLQVSRHHRVLQQALQQVQAYLPQFLQV